MKIRASKPLVTSFIAVASLFAVGCPNKLGDAVRPKDPTVADARGSQSVYVIEAQGQPLIVDWQPETRGDLEVAMREGVAVVGFDNRGLRLLKDCHIDGKYGFIGVNTKEQVVRLLSAEEVKANLPAAGLGILAKLEGELGRSQALDVAIVMVGKRKTTWSTASKSDLKGQCEGATHFVRGATIGAFAMRTGTKGKARTVAEIFGAGAGAAVESEKIVESADGLLDACRKAAPEADSPPPQCGALIRLELIRIDDNPSATAKKDGTPAKKEPTVGASSDADSCPSGFVFSAGKCTRPSEATTHACKMDDVADCTDQCNKGNAESCDTLGYMYAVGRGVPLDKVKAHGLFQKSCDGEFGNGCVNLGVSNAGGWAGAPDERKAVELWEHACSDHATALGCRFAAAGRFFGKPGVGDQARAVRLWLQGCRGGDQQSCSDLGVMYENGLGGVTKNERTASELYKMACDGGQAMGCGNLAFMYETGKGVSKNETFAGQLYTRACNENPNQCVWLGVARHIGMGVPKNAASAAIEYDTTCANAARRGYTETQGELLACTLSNELYGKSYPIDQKVLADTRTIWVQTCQGGTARNCTLLGISYLASDMTTAKKYIRDACTQGDTFGCELLKHPKLR